MVWLNLSSQRHQINSNVFWLITLSYDKVFLSQFWFHLNLISTNKSLLQILIRNRATDLDARMHDGTTPLILAARLAVEGMVEELINCHADVNAIDDFGNA